MNTKEKARQLRRDVLEAVYKAGRGHIGGAYSMLDLLTVIYYGEEFRHDKKVRSREERDYLILSKGHSAVGLYAVLCDYGYIDEDELNYINKGRMLAEHPNHKIPGIEIASGSLGHGISVATGIALSKKMDKEKNRVIVIQGDGECYEGSVWEAAMIAAHLKLSNLCLIIDRNNLITHGRTEEINGLEPLAEKWKAFGWETIEINGHDHEEIKRSLKYFYNKTTQKPTLILANTVKGYGVSFMENKKEWHHGSINEIQYEEAKEELSK